MVDIPNAVDLQIEDGVATAVPHSVIGATVADMPTDFGTVGLMDFPDAAFGEPVDEDSGERPEADEPDEDDETPGSDEDAEDIEDEEVEQPVLPPGVEEDQKEEGAE